MNELDSFSVGLLRFCGKTRPFLIVFFWDINAFDQGVELGKINTKKRLGH